MNELQSARERARKIVSLGVCFYSLTPNRAQFRSTGLCFSELINYSVTSWQTRRLAARPASLWYLTVSAMFTLYTWECVQCKYHSWGNHRAPRDVSELQHLHPSAERNTDSTQDVQALSPTCVRCLNCTYHIQRLHPAHRHLHMVSARFPSPQVGPSTLCC